LNHRVFIQINSQKYCIRIKHSLFHFWIAMQIRGGQFLNFMNSKQIALKPQNFLIATSKLQIFIHF